MIMHGTTQRALTWGGALAVVGLGMLLLPWLPTQAQDAQPAPRGPERPGRPDGPPPPPRDEEPRRADPEREAKVQKAREDVRKIEHSIRDMKTMIQDMHEKMEKMNNQLREAHRRLADAAGERPRPEPGPDGRLPRRDFGSPGGDPRGNFGNFAGMPNMPGFNRGFGGGDDRMREMERRLDQVVRELENLRRDLHRPGPGAPPPIPGDRRGRLPGEPREPPPPRGEREDGDQPRLERRPPPPGGGQGPAPLGDPRGGGRGGRINRPTPPPIDESK